MRYHDVQAVGRTPLEDDDQAFVRFQARLPRTPRGSGSWDYSRRSDHGQRAVAKKTRRVMGMYNSSHSWVGFRSQRPETAFLHLL